MFFQDGSDRANRAILDFTLEPGDLHAAIISGIPGARYTEAGWILPGIQRGPEKEVPLSQLLEALGPGLNRAAQSLFPMPFALPAERNSLVLTYKMLSQRRLKMLLDVRRQAVLFRERGGPSQLSRQEQLYRELGEQRFPQPVEDFLDFLALCELDDKVRPEDAVSVLATQLEAVAMGEHRLVWESLGPSAREMKLTIPGATPLDLYNASSAVKQLAPLLLWMRHGHPGQLLIIDEPELNLHPLTQAKLLETLAILVRLGKKVLLTTHSPYLMAHLNNLVAGDTSDTELGKRQASHLFLKDPPAFLKREEVGAWQMEEGKLRDLWEEGWGVRSPTLSDASGDLQNIYFAIREEEDRATPA